MDQGLERDPGIPRDLTKIQCGIRAIIAITGGGRPTRLLPHAKMLFIPIKLFLSAG